MFSFKLKQRDMKVRNFDNINQNIFQEQDSTKSGKPYYLDSYFTTNYVTRLKDLLDMVIDTL